MVTLKRSDLKSKFNSMHIINIDLFENKLNNLITEPNAMKLVKTKNSNNQKRNISVFTFPATSISFNNVSESFCFDNELALSAHSNLFELKWKCSKLFCLRNGALVARIKQTNHRFGKKEKHTTCTNINWTWKQKAIGLGLGCLSCCIARAIDTPNHVWVRSVFSTHRRWFLVIINTSSIWFKHFQMYSFETEVFSLTWCPACSDNGLKIKR